MVGPPKSLPGAVLPWACLPLLPKEAYVYIRFRTEYLYVKILDFEVFMDALNRDISRL